MLEGYTSLGFLAGQTDRMTLSLLVTGVTYRHPGLLAKIVTTLDVAVRRARPCWASGRPGTSASTGASACRFRRSRERFERLEETLQICRQMWSDDDGPYEGRHYRLAETICRPRPVQQPRPPDPHRGQRRAEDAAAGRPVRRRLQPVRHRSRPGSEHKLEVLARHCADVGSRPGRDRKDDPGRSATRSAIWTASSPPWTSTPGSGSTWWRSCRGAPTPWPW